MNVRYDVPSTSFARCPAFAQDEQDVPQGELLLAPSFARQGATSMAGWHSALNAN